MRSTHIWTKHLRNEEEQIFDCAADSRLVYFPFYWMIAQQNTLVSSHVTIFNAFTVLFIIAHLQILWFLRCIDGKRFFMISRKRMRMYQRFSSRSERILISFLIAIVLALNNYDDLLDYVSKLKTRVI